MSQYGNIRTVNCRLSLCVHTHRVCIHRRTDGSIHRYIPLYKFILSFQTLLGSGTFEGVVPSVPSGIGS